LVGGGVDFVVIGGIAAIAHGAARLTRDLDITYSKEGANLEALGRVLLDLEAKLRGADDDVPFVPDDRTLRRTEILTLDTTAGPLDLLGSPAGAPGYDELRRHADRITLGNTPVFIASIDHLVAMKLATGRPRDVGDIDELDAIRRKRG
jgi:hypothetical protein